MSKSVPPNQPSIDVIQQRLSYIAVLHDGAVVPAGQYTMDVHRLLMEIDSLHELLDAFVGPPPRPTGS